MRIGDSSNLSGVFQWNKTQQGLEKIHEKLATGKAINHASDDAAMLAVMKEFDKQVRAFRNAGENISAGLSALNISDSGSSAITDMLQRQRDLALQASNGTLNDDQRGAIDKEYQALSQEIGRIAESTEFNGQKLLNGEGPLADGQGNIHVGSGAGTTDQIKLTASQLTPESLGLIQTSVMDAGSAEKALSKIDEALKMVHANRAERGALHNRLEYSDSNNQTQLIQTTQSLSQIEDLDMAKGITEEVRQSILSQSNEAAISQFNQLSRTHLMALLQG